MKLFKGNSLNNKTTLGTGGFRSLRGSSRHPITNQGCLSSDFSMNSIYFNNTSLRASPEKNLPSEIASGVDVRSAGEST
jgi:hypothetical protein